MFLEILGTLVQALVVFSILFIAFGLAFFIIFNAEVRWFIINFLVDLYMQSLNFVCISYRLAAHLVNINHFIYIGISEQTSSRNSLRYRGLAFHGGKISMLFADHAYFTPMKTQNTGLRTRWDNLVRSFQSLYEDFRVTVRYLGHEWIHYTPQHSMGSN